MAGRPASDIWLKSHAGDPVKVDRKGRDPEYIKRPAMTLGLMVQPDLLRTIAAHRREFRGRGLLARFLYALPVSKVGRRETNAQEIDEQAQKQYNSALSALVRGLVGWSGDPAILTLTKDAAKAVVALEKRIEPSLGGEGELAGLADWGSKYVGAVIRIAGILHMGIHGAEEGVRVSIADTTIESAARIGEYFRACAVNAFAEMGTDGVTTDAIYLLDRIRTLNADELSERDMFRAGRRMPTMGALRAAVDKLVDHGWLVPIQQTKPPGGRPASPKYMVVRTKRTQRTKGSAR